MKKLMLILFALILTPAAIRAQDGHEYAPVLEKTINYKAWTLNYPASKKPVALPSVMQ